MEPKNVPYEMIVKQPYVQGAIVRDDFQGFREDYLALHCLLRMYKVKSLIEIGTSTGLGTKVICKAIGVRRWALLEALRIRRDRKVYSIDVPPGTDPKLIYPKRRMGIRSAQACITPILTSNYLGIAESMIFQHFIQLMHGLLTGSTAMIL